jgi:ATP-dependent Lon protease
VAKALKNAAVALIPLKNLLVFPGMIMPLFVGKPKSVAALEYATQNHNQIILSLQVSSENAEPTKKDLAPVAVLAELVQFLKLPDGTIKVLVEAKKRVTLKKFLQSDPFFQVSFQDLIEIPGRSEEIEPLASQVAIEFETYVQKSKKVPDETLRSILETENRSKFADLIGSYLTAPAAQKQSLLMELSVAARLQLLLPMIQHETKLVDVEDSLQHKVKAQIDKVQKEYYLKEKLKAIQKELGSAGEMDEVSEYQQKIETLSMPADVVSKAQKESLRLGKVPPMSSEAGVIRSYLDTLLELPWLATPQSQIDIEMVQKVLDAEHYGLEKVKERILEYIAVYQLTRQNKGTILCLMGPPGVGKTSIGQSIANSLGRKFESITLGGVRDQAELRGHRKTYVGAMPGRIIQALQRAKTTNPVILLDEIDKIASDFQGDPTAALLEILDPKQNKSFIDHYLEVPYNLSDVFFIATANSLHRIPRPLLDRMEVITLSGYTEDEKTEIVKRYIWNQGLKDHGLTATDLEYTEVGIRSIIRDYTHEAGLRDLIRNIQKVFRKAAKEKLSGTLSFHKFSKHNIHHFLGMPRFQKQIQSKQAEIGVVTGLAWTEAGGDTMPIEVAVLSGRGSLTITGQLGEVMQESAKAALSFVRSKSAALGLEENFYRKLDIHIHVPEGAIPKDGPSAGVAMATALISALTQIPIRGDVCMTGEVTLRGRVLAIGGVKEKVMAAVRAEMSTVILPYENQKDVKELSPKIKRGLKFVFAKKVEEVLQQALLTPLPEFSAPQIKNIPTDEFDDTDDPKALRV